LQGNHQSESLPNVAYRIEEAWPIGLSPSRLMGILADASADDAAALCSCAERLLVAD
jgi:hypothetical protein